MRAGTVNSSELDPGNWTARHNLRVKDLRQLARLATRAEKHVVVHLKKHTATKVKKVLREFNIPFEPQPALRKPYRRAVRVAVQVAEALKNLFPGADLRVEPA